MKYYSSILLALSVLCACTHEDKESVNLEEKSSIPLEEKESVHFGDKSYVLPEIDGMISTDEAILDYASKDFGGSIVAKPLAVISPKTVDDIAKVVKWAYENNISLTPRGTAHSISGQTLTDSGIVLKTDYMNQVKTLPSGEVEAQAGARIFQAVMEANKSGNYLPALPAFMAQTVGGLLSVGGVGPGAHIDGLTTDNISKLTVVTGKGEILICSEDQNPKLFDAVLGGIGQFGVIANATFKVKPAKKYIHTFTAAYPDIDSLLQEMVDSSNNEDFYAIDGYAWIEGKLGYVVEKAVWSDSEKAPSTQDIFSTRNNVIAESIEAGESLPYMDYAQKWNFLHGWWGQGAFPWADFFVPKKTAAEFFKESVQLMEENQALFSGETDFLGITVVRKQRDQVHSIQQIPSTDSDGLYFVPQFTPNFKTPEQAQEILKLNRNLLDITMSMGGKTYVIDELPNDAAKWTEHFGENWPQVKDAKHQFDPKGILSEPLIGLDWKK